MPKRIEFGGQTYEFPDDTPSEEITGFLDQRSESGDVDASTPSYRDFSTPPEEIEADELVNDEAWMAASARAFRVQNRKPFEGSREDLAEWSREFMADFNYNIVDTGLIANRVRQAPQRDKEAFLYMMDTFDNTSISKEGTWNATKSVFSDPTTYAGVLSLGLGSVFRAGVKKMGKDVFRQQLKKSIGRTGVVAGAEGGTYAYYDDRIRQGIEVDAGRKEERDAGQSAVNTALGASLGAGLGMGLDLIATRAGRAWGNRQSKKSKTVDESGNVTEIGDPSNRVKPEEKPTGDDTNVKPETPQDGEQPRAPQPVEIERKGDTWLLGDLELPVNEKRFQKGTVRIADAKAFAENVGEQLAAIPPEKADDILNSLGMTRLTMAEFTDLRLSTLFAREKLMSETARLTRVNRDNPSPELELAIKEADDQHAAVDALYSSLMSTSGFDLRIGREATPGTRNLSIQGFKDEGFDDETSQRLFIEQYEKGINDLQNQEIERKFTAQANEALAKGDLKKAMQLQIQKSRQKGDLEGLVQERQASPAAKVAEGAIGNVFSITTLQVNMLASTLKTVAVPALRAVVNDPLEAATRREMTASYSAMRSSLKSAAKGAWAATKYEQSLLTRDPNKFLENALAIKGRKGGAIRSFIRLTTAQDEFLSHINYQSYIAGRKAHDALNQGKADGLKGKELDKFIDKEVRKALDSAYQQVGAEQALIPLVTKGENLGLKGDELYDWVEKQALSDPEALRVANSQGNQLNQDAVDFLRDTLYKRSFTGSTGQGTISDGVSEAASGIDSLYSKLPSLKLLTGQLFLRTPIRVFEEGFRITPGLQAFAPRFLSDLKGANGLDRQVRARAEAMTSIAIAGQVMAWWAEGNLVGQGFTDYRQSGVLRNSAEEDPYTVKFGDETYSYRFLDPLATPIKIMANGMEMMDRMSIRKAQGEEMDDNAFQKGMESIYVGLNATIAAIRDANLFAGGEGTITAIESAADPDDTTGAWVRFLGEKMRMAVPSTIRKESQFLRDEPISRDPATAAQMAQAQLIDPWLVNDKAIVTPHAYDHMGRKRKMTDLGALRNIFSGASPEEREKGRPEDELAIDRGLIELQQNTGATFAQRFTKHSSTGDMDFRTVVTKNGEQTLFDRWNELYREYITSPEVAKGLRQILESPLPEGTHRYQGAKVEQVKNMLSNAKETAFKRLLSEQRSVIDKQNRTTVEKLYGESGLKDVDRQSNPKPIEEVLGIN